VAPAATLPPLPEPYHPPFGPIAILHRDPMLLVVDKPPGLLSVPGKAAGAADCLIARLHRMDGETRLVHRLDRDTSGVMVFARGARAQRHLGRQFERRYVEKRYIARVAGRLDGAGEVDLPLAADWPNRPRQMVSPAHGRPAVTRWTALGHAGGTTRVALAPLTGRAHQLRVHMAEIGHPILGDPLYGPVYGGPPAVRLMLHAERLAFRHPDGGAPVAFTRPAPF
jgi:tRNA pseudouridine32 synthase/23S rRNA pseudouridine746 synthase